jgi:hypothetical protein
VATIFIRQNDHLPVFRVKAFTEDAPIDFPTQFPGGVIFKMVGQSLTIQGTATGDAQGNLAYQWTGDDTDVIGAYEAAFVATDGSGRTQTFPSEANLKIEIIKAI